MSNCAGDEQRETIRLNCPEKRRQALRGRNLRRPCTTTMGPGLRRANGASDLWKLVLPGVVFISTLDIGGMPLKILWRSRTKTPLGWLGTLQPDEPPSVEPELSRNWTISTHEFWWGTKKRNTNLH